MGIASDFVLIVLAGLIGGLIARALRLPLLVGYVAAGVIIGPNTTGPKVVQVHDIELLAEIGVALLLFSLGLELSFRDLQPVRKVALIGGPIQILVTCALGTFGAAKGLGIPWTEAIWIGAMISVSSTAVVLKMLSEAGVTSTLASRVMVGMLVIQDLAVVPMLVVLPQLGNAENLLLNLVKAIGIAAALLGGVVLLGTRLLPRVLHLVLKLGSRELFLVSVVAIGMGVGWATYLAGLSFALGAFVAGLVLSESEFSHQALSDVVPIRDIFGLLFFVSVGMLLDPGYAVSHWLQILSVVVLTFAGKAFIFGAVARGFGYVNMAPWIIGLGLSQIGEFSFVLARTGVSSGLLSKSTYDLALTCTVVTMALAPMVTNLARPFGRMWGTFRKTAATPDHSVIPDDVPHQHVIVAGYGRSGRAAARVMRSAGIPLVVVDLNHGLYRTALDDGFSAIWGDITSDHILHAAHIESCRMMLLTMPDQNTIHFGIQRARKMNAAIMTIARAVRSNHVAELQRLGVDSVIQPEFEGGIEMVRQILAEYRESTAATEGLITEARRVFYGESAVTPE